MRADARAPRVPLHVRASPVPSIVDSTDCSFLLFAADAAIGSVPPPPRRLFLTQDNEFAGDNQKLTVEETVEYTSGMSIL